MILVCYPVFYYKVGYAQSTTSFPVDQWHIYDNDRFEYQICYPQTLVPQGEADNGDGQVFAAVDGARLRVYGSYSLSAIYKGDFSKEVASINQSILGKTGKMTYYSQHKNWAVSSGFDPKGNIFYLKSIKGKKGQIIVFILTYAPLLKSHYNPLIQNLAACFKENN